MPIEEEYSNTPIKRMDEDQALKLVPLILKKSIVHQM